ncbi:3 beta-hydroxysteroid dehydrogenase type 7 isoform X1 [Myiozetetes cayanensis]|uniref:3 beta-hydroxysteroid dehydrogenase type 7 isoform X1 n=1 Tax=Myiozetetes cayanensis TaxID=478635 RepID=UPI00215E6AD6|nr:3 beta-hydroxysteroid dehydrogenase type 7 isoform X1 [Myiozetetes cayanensis]XP_050162149.1 3 beta-hydroxysteroid dehydrogenase type 7 isoform X1 [Myiozetetes cayanensis]XP_050162150.1 3 beta-hydroxysteroid dehydrogenase type 7 isoform X1 [Myiozetetes cayanensis]XP_050162152.1 3 beta-hydroxysteroid dehydrogenase type 7 isoform X1 [Myiozetetes cayanensis]XP_050162153.1 3 beta-hydroxysteroid dehydrogenase type 7 isoform X1 [Myiozetetes cayanensis]XP_050162154.1 3 beta-hydroxysteroid dehydrog
MDFGVPWLILGVPQGLVVVVTGGCGFLGSHLVRLLLEKEPELRELRIFDLNIDPSVVPPGHESKVRLFRGDVSRRGAVGEVLGGAHLVFHAASLVDVWGGSSPEAIARVNVQGTKNVIWGCQDRGVPVLIYTSSMEVVGPNTRGDPFVRGDEETPYPTRHSEPYPLSKAQAERLVLEANGAPVRGGSRLVTVSLRPTGIFGERHPLLELFYRRGRGLGGRLPLTLPPNAEHGRVYAGNVAWMHILAARAALSHPGSVGGDSFFCCDLSPSLPYEEFNLSLLGLSPSPAPRPPPALLALLAKLNSALRALLGPLGWGFTPLLNPYTLAVASTPFTVRTQRARSKFGYQPIYSWEQARDRTREWLAQLG